MKNFDMTYHIEQSNLIENVHSKEELKQSLRAWSWLLENDKISETVILSTHYMITRNLLPYNLSGAWRTHNVQVGYYVAPHHLHIHELIRQWIEQMQHLENLDPKDMHIAFEKIHPFADGNGRIGRMLMWYHELKIGQVPTLIEYEDRVDYYNWFTDIEVKREYERDLMSEVLKRMIEE